MAKYPNRTALYEAHNIYRDAMREFVVRCLKKIRGTTPEEVIGGILNLELIDEPKIAIDINDFPRIIRDHSCWINAFSQLFGAKGAMDIRGMTSVIGDGRKLWAHPRIGDADSESTRTHLSLIADVLGGINEIDAKYEVETIRDRLFSNEVEEHPSEVENTALKENLSEMSDKLAKAQAEKTKLDEQLQETRNELAKMNGMESEWIASEERLADSLNLLKSVEAENADLKKRLNQSEVENADLKERLAEMSNQPVARTVEVENARLEERYETTSIQEWRRKIWKQLCDYADQKDTPVRFHTPSSENYLNVSRSLIYLNDFKMNVWLGRDNREIAIRLYMPKQNFYTLEKQRKEIEQEFCESIEWEELPQRRENRISLRKDIIDPTDESDWQNQYEWVISKLEKFHKKFNEVFLPRIQELNTSESHRD